MNINFSRKELNIILNVIKIYSAEINYKSKSKLFNELVKIKRKFERAIRPIKISSRKAKGRNLQKWVCDKISKLFNIEYSQKDDQCEIHSREMGQSGIDIILRGEALKKFPFSVECKSSESLNLLQTIQQVKNNQLKNTNWIIVYKRKALPEPIVILEWGVFEKLLKGESNG